MALTNIAPKLTAGQLEELVIAAQNFQYQHPELREGQALMNELYAISPELYVELTATESDCFYSDKYIESFMKYITGL